MARRLVAAAAAAAMLTGCASLTNDETQPVHFATPGCAKSEESCLAYNRRGSWMFDPPETVFVRRSDDPLRVVCERAGGKPYRNETGSVVGPKFAASIVLVGVGLTDAITDMHREYPPVVELALCKAP